MCKVINIIKCSIFALFLVVMCALCLFSADKEKSEAENRELAQMPEFSLATVKSGEFMGGFESYALDQFPFRQEFRKLKAINSEYILNLGDNNGFYKKDGVIAKITYPLDNESVTRATEKFNYIFDNFIKGKDMNVYMSVIPDKNDLIGNMKINKNELLAQLGEEMPYAEMIDIYDKLSADDFYVTDHHWKQEEIVEAAQHIAESMDASVPGDGYTVKTLTDRFYGEYYEQALLPADPESINVLHNEIIDSYSVTVNGMPSAVYDEEKAKGNSPYDAYLSGAMNGLVTIDNPAANNDKVLYVFRDSFGSSVIPLIAQGYSKTILIDIRALPSFRVVATLDMMNLNFETADVLFLYSTLVLNDSSQIN